MFPIECYLRKFPKICKGAMHVYFEAQLLTINSDILLLGNQEL